MSSITYAGCVWLSVGDSLYVFPIPSCVPSNHLSSSNSVIAGEEQDVPIAKRIVQVSEYSWLPLWLPPPLFSPSIHSAEETGLSRPFPSSRCAQDIELRFVYDHTELSKIQNSSLCYYSRRRFVETTDEDPLIKLLKGLKRWGIEGSGYFFGTSLSGQNHICLSVSFSPQISTFVKTPSSRHFVILGHENSDAAIFMTQVSSIICPLRWLSFLYVTNPPIPEPFNMTNIYAHCAIALPSKRRSFTLTSGNNYELRIHEIGASTHHRRKF